MGPLHALRVGVGRALRYWPAWLALWLATWLAALPLVVFPALGLWDLAHTPVAAELAAGLRASHLLDIARLVAQNVPIPDQPDLVSVALSRQVAALAALPLALPLLGGVVSAFTWGGLLLTYAEAPAPFRWSRFLWGSWRWFGSFLLLAAMQVVLLLFSLAALLFLGWLALRLGALAAWLWLILFVSFAGLWLAVFELARVQAVATGTRNPFRALKRAFRLIFDQPLILAVYYLLALLVLLVVHLLFRGLLLPGLPLNALLLALLVQQSFVLARLLARALRVAGLVAFAQDAAAQQMVETIAGEPWPGHSMERGAVIYPAPSPVAEMNPPENRE